MACPTGKVQYKTRPEAEGVIIGIYRQRANNPQANKKEKLKTPTGIYFCKLCKFTHLTSRYDNRSPYVREKCNFILYQAPKSISKKIIKQEPHAKANRFQKQAKKTAQTLRHEKSFKNFKKSYKEKGRHYNNFEEETLD